MTFAISDTVFLRVRLKVCFDDRCTLCHLGYNLIYCKYMQAPPKKKHMIEWFGTLYYIYLACVCVCAFISLQTPCSTPQESGISLTLSCRREISAISRRYYVSKRSDWKLHHRPIWCDKSTSEGGYGLPLPLVKVGLAEICRARSFLMGWLLRFLLFRLIRDPR